MSNAASDVTVEFISNIEDNNLVVNAVFPTG